MTILSLSSARRLRVQRLGRHLHLGLLEAVGTGSRGRAHLKRPLPRERGRGQLAAERSQPRHVGPLGR